MNIVESIKHAEKQIVIPERIEYPAIRLIIEPEVLVKGDTVMLNVVVYDSKGNEKVNNAEKLYLKEYNTSEDIALVGIAKLTIVEQPIVRDKDIPLSEDESVKISGVSSFLNKINPFA